MSGSIPQIVPLTVNIPGGAPTGVVFNSTTGFVVKTAAGSAAGELHLRLRERDVLSAWSGTVSGTNADVEFSKKHYVYKGLALASLDGESFLYAANFSKARIDVFDDHFRRVDIPARVQGQADTGGLCSVRCPTARREPVRVLRQAGCRPSTTTSPGPGTGSSTCMTRAGILLTRLISRGDLNSPWGLVIAPASFGAFGGDLLVGNFGDGAIHAYDPTTGAEKGQLTNTDGNPILINGLWALRFGNGKFASPNTLVFTAGIGDEGHGLLGEIDSAAG